MNSEKEREDLLLKVLRKSPVLSMYHTANGFDMEGFIAAYEMWKTSVREALEQCDAAQGPSTKFIDVWKRYMPAPTPREANLYSWCERFWNEGRRAALSTEAQGEPVMYVRVDALARLKKWGQLNMVGYNSPNHSPRPVVALYVKPPTNVEAQPDGYFYETYSGAKGHFLGAMHDRTKWRVDHEDLKLTPFWLSAPQAPEVTGAVATVGEPMATGGYRIFADSAYLAKGTKLYPPSAIEAAVREKLEEAARITPLQAEKLALKVEIERGFEEDITTYENGDVHTTRAGLAAIIIEYFRALMESPHTSVEEPAN